MHFRIYIASMVFVSLLIANCSNSKSEKSSPLKAKKQEGYSQSIDSDLNLFALSGADSLTLDLTYFPNGSVTSLCVDRFSPEEEIAEIFCQNDRDSKIASILAKNVRQVCSGADGFGESAATEELEIVDCDTVEIKVFNFTPKLELTLEQRN